MSVSYWTQQRWLGRTVCASSHWWGFLPEPLEWLSTAMLLLPLSKPKIQMQVDQVKCFFCVFKNLKSELRCALYHGQQWLHPHQCGWWDMQPPRVSSSISTYAINNCHDLDCQMIKEYFKGQLSRQSILASRVWPKLRAGIVLKYISTQYFLLLINPFAFCLSVKQVYCAGKRGELNPM